MTQNTLLNKSTTSHDQAHCNRQAQQSIFHPKSGLLMDVRENRAACRAAINMEKHVGSLQEQALKRKERLKALRDKQVHVSICTMIHNTQVGPT